MPQLQSRCCLSYPTVNPVPRTTHSGVPGGRGFAMPQSLPSHLPQLTTTHYQLTAIKPRLTALRRLRAAERVRAYIAQPSGLGRPIASP